MSVVTERIGKQIREARKAKGMTQQDLGDLLKIGQATVNRYESGRQNLTVETIQKISTALDEAIIIEFLP